MRLESGKHAFSNFPPAEAEARLEHVLGLNPRKPNRAAEMRVAAILKKRLGFSKRRGEDGVKGDVRRRKFEYWRP